MTVASVDTGLIIYAGPLINNIFHTSHQLRRPQSDPHLHGSADPGAAVRSTSEASTSSAGSHRSASTSRSSGRSASRSCWRSPVSTTASTTCSRRRAPRTRRPSPLGVDFGGNWWLGAAFVAILAHVYIFYGFESAGDVAEEVVHASKRVPRAIISSLLDRRGHELRAGGRAHPGHPVRHERAEQHGERWGAVPDQLERLEPGHPGHRAVRRVLRLLQLRPGDPGGRRPAHLLVQPRPRAAGERHAFERVAAVPHAGRTRSSSRRSSRRSSRCSHGSRRHRTSPSRSSPSRRRSTRSSCWSRSRSRASTSRSCWSSSPH